MSCKIESVDIIQGNSFTLNIYVTHYNIDTQVMEPYILDDATDAFVRLVGNNGVVRKFTNITINENIATCFIDGTKLKTGTYGIEFSFKKDGYDKRSYKCCMLKVHNCDCQVDEQPLSEYDIAVAFGADNQVLNVGGLVYAHVDDHLDKNSQNPVTNSAITNTLTNDYASKQWVIDVMTDGQIDLSSYVSDAELAETLTSYVKDDELAEILTSYVTNSQLQEAIDAIPQPDLSSYATIEYVDRKVGEIPQPDLSSYATREYVDRKVDEIPQPDLTDYYTKQEIDDKFDNIPSAEIDTSSYVTRQELTENNFAYASNVADLTEELIADEQVIATHAHKIHDLESYFPSYATIDYVNSVVAGGDIDLSSYVTKQELSDAHYAYEGDLTNYTTLTDFNERVSNLQNQIDNIDPSVDIDMTAYVKKSELQQNDYAYNSALSDYTTLTQFNERVSNLQNQIDNIEPSVDIDMTAYVTHDYLSSQSYVNSRQLNELTNAVIDDELVLARAANDINKIIGYLNSYVKLSDYNELLDSYNQLSMRVAYMYDNVEWSGDAQPEIKMYGYIVGTTTKEFEATFDGHPLTFTSPSFSVQIPNAQAGSTLNRKFANNSYLTSITSAYIDLSSTYSITRLFYNCSNLKTLNISDWDVSNVDIMQYTFGNCTKLTSLDLSGWDTSKVLYMTGLFSGCTNLVHIDHDINTARARDLQGMFRDCENLEYIDVTGFDTRNVMYMGEMFKGCDNLVILDVTGFDTSNVRYMNSMFANCYKLADLDVSSFDTSSCENMSNMFSTCSALSYIDVSNFNTRNVKNMYGMFSGCTSLSHLNVDSFDTSNCEDMSNMFALLYNLSELDVTRFDTSKVKDMFHMFGDCKKLTTLDLHNFNTSQVTNMKNMFHACESLTSLDISLFDTSNVTNMYGMFEDCYSLSSLALDNFNTEKVTDMRYMFKNCDNLTSLDLSSFDTSNVKYMYGMFHAISKIETLDLSNWSYEGLDDTQLINGEYVDMWPNGSGKLNTVYVDNVGTNTLNKIIRGLSHMNYKIWEPKIINGRKALVKTDKSGINTGTTVNIWL